MRASDRHTTSVHAADGAELVACADLDGEVAREFAAEQDCEWFTDTTEMIEAADIDAVSICTPSGTHADVAVECAAAGADMLCEKPLDVLLDRMDTMIDAAEDASVVLAGVFQRRTHGSAQRAKEAIETGELGDLVLGDTAVKWSRSQGYYDSAAWRGTREIDGGCLMNQTIHNIDCLQWLMGGVESVYAKTDTLTHEMECEDAAAVAVTFENGAVGTIEGTTSVRGGGTRTEISGTQGSIAFEKSQVTHFETNDGVIDVETERMGPDDGHVILVEEFVDALRAGSEPMVPAREARKAVEVILAAYESAERNEEVYRDDL